MFTRALHSSRPALSHVGSAPVVVPSSVQLSIDALSPTAITVQGPLGRLSIKLFPFLLLNQPSVVAPGATQQATLSVQDPTIKHQRAIWGLTRSLLANAVVGVSAGYTTSLRLVGVGYRATLEAPSSSREGTSAQRLNLKLGFAHPVLIDLPPDVTASTPSTTTIELRGIDKQRLGEVAARIRSWRVPEPYNVLSRNRLNLR